MMRLLAFVLLMPLLLAGPAIGEETFSESPEISGHHLRIALQPDTNLLQAVDHVVISDLVQGEFSFTLNKNLVVSSLAIEDTSVEFETCPYEGPGAGETGVSDTIQLVVVDMPTPTDRFTIEYSGEIYDPIDPSAALGRVRGDFTSGIIGPEGVYLSSETGWYPDTYYSMATFEVTVTVPENWLAVTQGDLSWRDDSGESFWTSDIPSDGCVLVANEYHVNSSWIDGIKCSTYFYEDNPELSDSFLDKLEEYLPAYVQLFGPFPYTRFDIVENFFTTGYGMPAFTLLGSRVLTMPYATAEGSLAHELVHCWWGNYVFPDWDHGNWCEGVTYFSTNYYWNILKNDEESARDFRFRDMLKYSIQVSEDEEYPVREFRTKLSEVDGSIGYSKAASIFTMLHLMLGERLFFDSLRFALSVHGGKRTTWDDFHVAFESTGKIVRYARIEMLVFLGEMTPDDHLDEYESIGRWNLDGFFESWLDNKGTPELSIESIEQETVDDGYRLGFRIVQDGETFHIPLEILICTENEEIREYVELGPEPFDFEIVLDEQPLSIELDPDYYVFRRLSREEIPPCLNAVLEADRLLVVLPGRGEDETLQVRDYSGPMPGMRDVSVAELYRELAESIAESGENVKVKLDYEVTDEDLQAGAVLCLGAPGYNTLMSRLVEDIGEPFGVTDVGFTVDGSEYNDEAAAILVSSRNPYNSDYDLTFYFGNSPQAIFKAGLIFFYGWDSYVVYESGSPVTRGQWEPGRGPLFVHLEDFRYRALALRPYRSSGAEKPR